MQVACGGDNLPDEQIVRGWLQATLGHAGWSTERDCEIAVRLVDAEEGRRLNRHYRQRDYATNVLSFAGIDDALLPEGEPAQLGDLVLCVPVVEQEASEQGKKAADHWAHLLVHGTLHLLGHDHEHDDDAALMESIETAVLAAAGLPDPYQERSDS